MKPPRKMTTCEANRYCSIEAYLVCCCRLIEVKSNCIFQILLAAIIFAFGTLNTVSQNSIGYIFLE